MPPTRLASRPIDSSSPRPTARPPSLLFLAKACLSWIGVRQFVNRSIDWPPDIHTAHGQQSEPRTAAAECWKRRRRPINDRLRNGSQQPPTLCILIGWNRDKKKGLATSKPPMTRGCVLLCLARITAASHMQACKCKVFLRGSRIS